MNETKLTKRNIRKALIEAYNREVSLHPDCEEGYQSLSEGKIQVFITTDERVKVQFPCLQVQSVAACCAQQAIKTVSRQFFWKHNYSGIDIIGFISTKDQSPENLKTTPAKLFWIHEFDSKKEEEHE